MHSASPALELTANSGKWPAVLALALGVFLVFAVGFAQPAAVHNAVHDTRHAFGLPCH